MSPVSTIPTIIVRAKTIISHEAAAQSDYDFVDDSGQRRTGTAYRGCLYALGVGGEVVVIRVRAKSLADVEAVLARYPTGKAAEIPIRALGMQAGLPVATAA